MSEKPPSLWYDDPDEHRPPPPPPPAAPAPRPTPPIPAPPAPRGPERRRTRAWKIAAIVGGSLLALVLAISAVVVALGDDEPAARPRAAGGCAPADVKRPFDALPPNFAQRTAGEGTRASVAARILSATGSLEVRLVTAPGGEVVAGIVSDVDDPQVFADAFISAERDRGGPPPRRVDLRGKQGAVVPLDYSGSYTLAVMAFLDCRAVLVFGTDEQAMTDVAAALLRDG